MDMKSVLNAKKKQQKKMVRWQQVKENENKKLAEEKSKADFFFESIIY
jgi:hypothetical protein